MALARRGSLLAIVVVALRAILVVLLASLIILYHSRPPESTLSYDGQAETGQLGLYRWGEDRLLGAIDNACSSTAPAGSSTAGNVPPFTGEVLEIPEGSRLVFEHRGEEPLTEVSARSFAFEEGGLRAFRCLPSACRLPQKGTELRSPSTCRRASTASPSTFLPPRLRLLRLQHHRRG